MHGHGTNLRRCRRPFETERLCTAPLEDGVVIAAETNVGLVSPEFELVSYRNTIETLERLEPALAQVIPRSSESPSASG